MCFSVVAVCTYLERSSCVSPEEVIAVDDIRLGYTVYRHPLADERRPSRVALPSLARSIVSL